MKNVFDIQQLSREKEIFEKILNYIGTHQKFWIIDEEPFTIIYAEPLFDFIGKLSIEMGFKLY